MREVNFSPGTAVEVNTDSDTHDVWFPATFVKQVTNKSFLVEYQSSREAGVQKVAVDSLHIRPSPPCLSNQAFNLLEKVEAYCDFHWLSGVVTKILGDGRYIVFFKRTKKEKELCHTDLRLHMDWTNGKWVHSSADTTVTSNSEKRSGNFGRSRISALTLDSSQKELQMPGAEKTNCNSATPSNTRIKQTSANGDATHSRFSTRSNGEPAFDAPSSTETCKSKTTKMEESQNGTSGDFDSLSTGHPGHSYLKRSEVSNQPSDPAQIKHPATRKRGRPPKLQALVPDTVDETPNKSDMVKPLGSIVIGLTHDGKMNNSLGGSSSQHLKLEQKKAVQDEEKYFDTSADHEIVVSMGSKQQKEGEVTNLKRKRGRPPKVLFQLGSTKTKETEEEKDDVSDVKDNAQRYPPTNEVEKPDAGTEPPGISDSTPSTDSRRRQVRVRSDQAKRRSDMHRLYTRSAARKHVNKHRKISKEIVVAEINEQVKPVTLRGRKQKETKQIEPPTEDVHDSIERAAENFNNGVTRNVDRVVAGTSSNASDDDRPLSAWFEGAHAPLTTDGRVSLVLTAGQCDETGERRDKYRKLYLGQPKEKETEKRDEFASAEKASQENDVHERPDETPIQSTAIVLVSDQDLPFVKNSLVWEMIESMEVLKRIPQKPHFHPLYNRKEECREGLAIGSMVTFTSLVERISRARFGDPKSLLKGYLEALVELEELGFNVVPVREKLNRLLLVKERYELAQNTSKEIGSQIMERNQEKLKIDEEIADLDKKIAELKERRAFAVLKNKRKDTEITLLQSSVDAVKGVLHSAREEFEKVIASLW